MYQSQHLNRGAGVTDLKQPGTRGYFTTWEIAWHDGKFLTSSNGMANSDGPHGTLCVLAFHKDGNIYFSSRNYIRDFMESNPDLIGYEIDNGVRDQMKSSYETSAKPRFTLEVFPDEPQFFHMDGFPIG